MAAMEKNIMKPRTMRTSEREVKEFDERVVEVQRVSRVVKGGRRIRFRALVVIGDHKGRVGAGVAKANEVAEAVKKATSQAKKCLINVPVIEGTIPHEVNSKYGASRIMLKPAAPGTTIVAGGSVRVVAELAGITDLLAKIQGGNNKINNVNATLKAFSSFNKSVVEKVRVLAKRNEQKGEIESLKPVEKAEPKEEVKAPKAEKPVVEKEIKAVKVKTEKKETPAKKKISK